MAIVHSTGRPTALCGLQRIASTTHVAAFGARNRELGWEDRDLRGLDTDPYRAAPLEAELARRRGRHLGDDRWSPLEADAHAIALEIQVDGPALPDIPRGAIGPSSVESNGAGMHDREDLAIAGTRCHQ